MTEHENDLTDSKQAICRQVETIAAELFDLSKALYDQPEIAYEEQSSRIILLEQSISSSDSIIITDDMRSLPAIIEFERALVPLLIKRSEINTTFTKESREYKSATQQIEQVRDEIRYEINKALNTDKFEAEVKHKKIATIKNKIKELQLTATQLVNHEKNLEELKRRVNFHKEKYLV